MKVLVVGTGVIGVLYGWALSQAGVASSPIVVGEAVYFGALDGKVYAVKR